GAPAEPACAKRMSLTRVSSSRRKFLPAANCGSDSVGLINSKFVQLRYPWSEPNCVTRSVSRAGSKSHTVAVRDGCTKIPLALRRWLRRTRPFLSSAGQAIPDFGSSTRIRQNYRGAGAQAAGGSVEICHRGRRHRRRRDEGRLTIVFFRRPPLRLTRSLNHRASADCG